MAAKKYPVGTSIRYIGYCSLCKNKTGKVVGVGNIGYSCYISLPQSSCMRRHGGRIPAAWRDIIPFAQKGEQLLFSFMIEQDA